ncbi:MAG: type II toxin-antitoxin system RelE/ParE family toxin [Proteobacteria bacterium]|nr:type II toxin-antitoxin system RelE/ParE family toxin [Pseudomonadota bacterium]
MTDDEKRLKVVFYKTDAGAEPVRDWLRGLNKEDRLTIGIDIKTVEFGWPIGMPTCRALADGIWEVRSNLPGRRISRVLFCIDGGYMVLLHAFVKKSRATPKQDLDVARRRKRQLEAK